MPRTSERQQRLATLRVRRARLLNAAAGDWEKKLERAMCFLRVVFSARDSIENHRYLAPRTRKISKSTEMLDRLLHLYGSNEFRQIARMNRETFVSMNRLIKHHTFFLQQTKVAHNGDLAGSNWP
ncbi:hypothetical protein PsorP6_002461 [Peronosclerospora sorghi]|uniref:Uncharacterized protein n=1 Tax=Peronosclerospora sorghi TaxID=230839 RepID=A0ACC0WQY2_9STRA|nr:hypothetical protein PsorP6_002461 [Peronosclerospora sorghi]